MPSSYTSSLRLTLPVQGELAGSWGNTVNSGITQLLDTAVAGTASITMTAANYTLTNNYGATDEARSMFLVLGGTPGASFNVICPAVSKLYFVTNNTGFAQTVKTASGSGISVPNGARMTLRCDGTDVVEALNAFGNLTYTGTVTGGTGVVNIGSGQLYKDASGNLGIGTSSPGAKLHVKVGTDQNLLTTTVSSKVTNLATNDAGSAYVDWQQYANQFLWFTASTERMRLDSSGNLGLGVTPSAWVGDKALQVNWGSISSGYEYSVNVSSVAYRDNTTWKYLASSQAPARYEQIGGAHKWFTAATGTAGNAISFTQAMTLDAGGSLLVGTTTYSRRLTVGVPNAATLGANDDGVSVANASGRITLTLTGSTYSYYGIPADSGLVYSVNRLALAADSGTPITFHTSGSERARITSGGDLLVGATSNPNNYKTHIVTSASSIALGIFANNATTPSGINVYYGAAAPNNSNANTSYLYCNDTSTVRIQLSSNGGIQNYSANDINLSDRREKTNFAPAKSYLDIICAIPVQTFNYIDQSEDDPGLTLGVVAQDVQAVAPELVMESNWGTADEPKQRLSIYQTDLQYALMKCIQEQQVLITDLRARVAALEAA